MALDQQIKELERSSRYVYWLYDNVDLYLQHVASMARKALFYEGGTV